MCVWGRGDGGVCCVYGGPHIEGPPQPMHVPVSLRVKSQRVPVVSDQSRRCFDVVRGHFVST